MVDLFFIIGFFLSQHEVVKTAKFCNDKISCSSYIGIGYICAIFGCLIAGILVFHFLILGKNRQEEKVDSSKFLNTDLRLYCTSYA